MKNHSRLFVLLLCLSFMLSPRMVTQAQSASKTIKIAAAAPTSPMTLYSIYGPVTFGKDFGLSMTPDDITTFDSTTVAAQATIAGQADVLFASFGSSLVLRQAGQDFKLFCPGNAKIDHVLVGRNGVTTLAQVLAPETRVGIDSPGGGASTVLNAIFAANGIEATTNDLKNVKLLESIQLRQTSWAANEVDVTTIRLSQFRQSQKDVPDGVIIAKVYEAVPLYIFAGFTAPADWLTANRDTAAAFCAASLKGVLALTNSFDTYDAAVKAFISKPPSDDVLKESFDLINQYAFWAPDLSMKPEAVSFMSSLAERTGILKQPANPTDVLDMETYTAALNLLSETDRAALQQISDLASPTAEPTPIK